MADDNLLLREREKGPFGIEGIRFLPLIAWNAASYAARAKILKLASACYGVLSDEHRYGLLNQRPYLNEC